MVLAPTSFLSWTYSSTARAMLMPSKVEVPRPISSKIMRLFLVAFFRISATSAISIINVDWPAERSSDAPTRVKIASTMPISATAAGTKHPAWAMMVMMAVWRIKVDLPAMLGPVMMATRSSFISMSTSLGTKGAS